jgi:hypothetical protein
MEFSRKSRLLAVESRRERSVLMDVRWPFDLRIAMWEHRIVGKMLAAEIGMSDSEVTKVLRGDRPASPERRQVYWQAFERLKAAKRRRA